MSDVIDLNSFKKKKKQKEDKNRRASDPGYQPLTDRLARIRTSIERINTLMAELKAMSKTEPKKK